MNKDYTSEVKPGSPGEEELELINAYSRKKLAADEVYTFSVLLCDNEVDRDLERFDTAALPKLAELFVGKTGILDHSMRSADQTSRLYSAQVITDESRITSVGERYSYVLGRAYMSKNAKNADLIAEIDAGIKKEASIGCSVGSITCSVCGADLKASRCKHRRGKFYGGKLCHGILSEPTDAYEWSFVAVPAQREAGVTKAFLKTYSGCADARELVKALSDGGAVTLGGSEAQSLARYVDALGEEALDGRLYRQALMDECVKWSAVCLPELKPDDLGAMCGQLSCEELRRVKNALETEAAKRLPLSRQFDVKASNSDTANENFNI